MSRTQKNPLRRIAIHTLLASVAALAPAMMTPPALGQDIEKQKQGARGKEDIPTKEHIQKLITALDDDRFIPRENASNEILRAALPWIRTHQKHLPWKAWLIPQTNYSPEQNMRLRYIIEKCEEEERQLLWLPTRFKAPQGWDDPKNPPRVCDVLKELEKQMGETITIPKECEDKRLTDNFNGYTFWEVIDALRSTYGDSFSLTPYGKGRINIASEKKHYFSASQATQADLALYPYQPFTEQTRMYMEFRSEQKIPLCFFQVQELTVWPDKEQEIKISPWESTMARSGDNYCAFEVSRPKGVKTIDLLAQVKLTGYETKTFHVDDLGKRTGCETDVCATEIGGLEEYFSYVHTREGEDRKKQSEGWLLSGEFGKPLSLLRSPSETILSAIQFEAFDEKGKRIEYKQRTYNSDGTNFQWKWGFAKKPVSLTIRIPDKPTSSIQTYFFKDIPLVRDDFHARPIEAPSP